MASHRRWHIRRERRSCSLHCSNPKQLKWYEMTDTAAPHISMALHPGHEARELGGMTKRLKAVADWEPTDIYTVLYSPTAKSYWITGQTEDMGLLTHKQISRCHGREQTDGPGQSS